MIHNFFWEKSCQKVTHLFFLKTERGGGRNPNLKSISRIAVLVNIGIPVEGDEGFDEDTSYQLMDKIANDPMRYIYVSEVLNWWVNTLF